MSFDAALPTMRDRIRFMVGDTDASAAVFPDDTYDAALASYTNWKRAAAEMAEAVAVQYDSRPTGLTAQGDGSINWQDRAKTLRATAARLWAEAESDDAGATGVGQMISVRSRYMAGGVR